ncbi:hypothetical protein OIDMADRAFT_141232 [Oidiodendron maius Zn]|uniref:DUF6923 domain-containing protein n=1 Tax=Oidiodendron maius (strain Zn) TaxID=913774 RepID=A0A0C3DTR9_OIDMZ|nr:hypothetical protein OIDMADRAFT_141232 [Oidiodendron maius Zn]
MTRPRRPFLCAIVALSTISNIAASPISGGICLPLGIDLGGIFDLFDAPLLTEVVPYFTSSITTLASAGVYTLGSGFAPATTITAQGPTEVTITNIATQTTTYPCPTSTSFTSSFWDPCKGCSTTATCRWTPSASTTTVTSTVTSTVTGTVTASCTSTPTPPPLSCDPYGYLIQYATFYRVDLTTGATTKVKAGLGDNSAINAIGYNTLDNFIYGFQASTSTIIRIAADGTSSTVVGADSPPPSSNVGDVDSNGMYWVSAAGESWSQIDLFPGSATYGKTISKGTATPLGLQIADWVYIPITGEYLYSVGTNSTSGGISMIRFSMASKEWEKVANYPTLKSVSTLGAQYGMNNGTLWASDNNSGDIWQFPIDGTSPFKVSQGPSSGSNDGARCVLNLLA